MILVKPLYTRQRSVLLRCSIMMCTGALLLAPLTGSPSIYAEAQDSKTRSHHELPALPGALQFPQIVITKDPFVPQTVKAPIDGSVLVRAIVMGATPKALVNVNGQSQMLGVGSTLLGTRVTAIEANGIRLESGQALPLTGNQP